MRRLLAASLTLALAPAAVASGAPTLLIYGGGSGHGVGMSQYGAYGLALHGFDYRAILAHYYTGTTIGQAPSGRLVRVLMQSGVGTASFTGAGRAGGRRLAPSAVYRATAAGSNRVSLAGPHGSLTVPAPLVVTPAAGALRLLGAAENGRTDGRYRGSLELRPSGGRLDVLNVVGIDDYARGVVSVESDPTWPLAELEAQAVAARTYSITEAGHPGFDVYADTRSQLYVGVAGETPATDKAVAMTAGQVVTYQGRPVITFYFDTSGGRTESIQNAFQGSPPAPWLVSVDDPYDSVSPRHRFGPLRMTLGEAQSRLGGLVRGTLRRIVVTRRGASPRILTAVVVGSAGTTRVTGAELASSFHLPDTWACFAVTAASGQPPAGWEAPCMPPSGAAPAPVPGPGAAPPTSSPTGGTGAPPDA
ncbi:MAG TPA: SpoIID/LytB domain-containing protein [Solirubrobacteraceae bacterium]|nr:SpoIID/LytB domain-containing protein [Solirubrobacteraceae bacterium]